MCSNEGRRLCLFFVCFVFVPPIHVGIVECVNLTERAKILRLQKRERERLRENCVYGCL